MLEYLKENCRIKSEDRERPYRTLIMAIRNKNINQTDILF
jgi:hypothetical protein